MGRSNTESVIMIIICAAVIFGIVAITFALDAAFGQVQNITSPPAPAPQQLEQVVQEVPAIAEQVDANSTTNTLIGTAVTAIGGYITTNFLKQRKDKEKIETYSSDTVRIVFNHVMDNYNDFAKLAAIEAAILELQYTHGYENLTYKQLLDTIIDPVTGETWGMRKKTLLNNIVQWNVEYYGSPSTDPNIVCPDPKNKIARTMTEIRKYSVPSTVKPNAETAT